MPRLIHAALAATTALALAACSQDTPAPRPAAATIGPVAPAPAPRQSPAAGAVILPLTEGTGDQAGLVDFEFSGTVVGEATCAGDKLMFVDLDITYPNGHPATLLRRVVECTKPGIHRLVWDVDQEILRGSTARVSVHAPSTWAVRLNYQTWAPPKNRPHNPLAPIAVADFLANPQRLGPATAPAGFQPPPGTHLSANRQWIVRDGQPDPTGAASPSSTPRGRGAPSSPAPR